MIQDHQLLDVFHSLSPDKQAEVVDFILFLKNRMPPSQANEPHFRRHESRVLNLAGSLPGAGLSSPEIDEVLYG